MCICPPRVSVTHIDAVESNWNIFAEFCTNIMTREVSRPQNFIVGSIKVANVLILKWNITGRVNAFRLMPTILIRGSNPGGARFFAPLQTGPEAHPASCTMGTGSFLGVRCCRCVTLTPHPLLQPRSKIE